ncbi:MAG: helix-turn-helix domain-containing protein [Bacteroidetes bacterium]|nr:helix-turn-helix domain-containing protein [Bacteroidota bacterium]
MAQTLEIKLILDEETKQELRELNREILREELSSAFGDFQNKQSHDYSFTIKDVAKKLNVSEITVRRWYKNKDLKGKKMGGVIRFKPSEIEKALDSMDKLLYRKNNNS